MARLFLRRPLIRTDFLACARDLSDSLPDIPSLPGVTIRLASPEDVPRLAAAMGAAEFRGTALPPADVARRYDRGDICLIAEAGGEIAYLSWVRFGDVSLEGHGLRLRLAPDEAYVDAVFAFPAHRGQGLATAVAAERLRWLRARDIRSAYGWVAPHNTPMLKLMRRAGWRVVGHLTQLAWQWGRRIWLVNLAVVTNPADPLARICTPDRLSFPAGLTIYRRGGRPPLPTAERA